MEQIDIANKSKRWNQEEEELLKKLYNEKELDVITISKTLKRTPNGIMQRLIKLKIIKFDFEARGFDKEQIDDFIKECQKKNITNEQKEETNSNSEMSDKKKTITNDMLLKHILELKEEISKLRKEINELKNK
jgi:hypothetical protein